MTALAEFLVGLLASIPGAAAQLDDDAKARVLAQLDETRRALTAIGPNAPAVRAAIEARREARAADDTRPTRTGEPGDGA